MSFRDCGICHPSTKRSISDENTGSDFGCSLRASANFRLHTRTPTECSLGRRCICRPVSDGSRAGAAFTAGCLEFDTCRSISISRTLRSLDCPSASPLHLKISPKLRSIPSLARWIPGSKISARGSTLRGHSRYARRRTRRRSSTTHRDRIATPALPRWLRMSASCPARCSVIFATAPGLRPNDMRPLSVLAAR